MSDLEVWTHLLEPTWIHLAENIPDPSDADRTAALRSRTIQYATSTPFDKVVVDHLACPIDVPFEFHFECVDAAFWVMESDQPNLLSLLQEQGFETEPCDNPAWRS